jgi:hypothetical protein
LLDTRRNHVYLAQQLYLKQKGLRIINLCRSYRYLSLGYYCSLLAEARQHKIIPSVRTIIDLSSKAIYSLDFEDFDNLVQKSFKKTSPPGPEDSFELYIFFGQTQLSPCRNWRANCSKSFAARYSRSSSTTTASGTSLPSRPYH